MGWVTRRQSWDVTLREARPGVRMSHCVIITLCRSETSRFPEEAQLFGSQTSISNFDYFKMILCMFQFNFIYLITKYKVNIEVDFAQSVHYWLLTRTQRKIIYKYTIYFLSQIYIFLLDIKFFRNMFEGDAWTCVYHNICKKQLRFFLKISKIIRCLHKKNVET